MSKEVQNTCKFLLTVDEQLLPLKSHCSFVTFMPNKPDKYGVKFWVLADVETKHVSNIGVYLGAQEKEQRGAAPLSELVVATLFKISKERVTTSHVTTFLSHYPLPKNLQKTNYLL